MENKKITVIIANSTKPVVLNFWSPLSDPSLVASPIMETLAKECGDKLEYFALKTDENQELVKHFGIKRTPTMIGFVGGFEVKRLVGQKPAMDYKDTFESLANGTPFKKKKVSGLQVVGRFIAGGIFIYLGLQPDNWFFLLFGGLIVISVLITIFSKN